MSCTIAQSYKLDQSGKIITIKKDTTKRTVKIPDKVYSTVGTTVFYIGSKGGIYYYKTSKKTGKKYKVYVSSK